MMMKIRLGTPNPGGYAVALSERSLVEVAGSGFL